MTAGDRLIGKSSILAVETMSYLVVELLDIATDESNRVCKIGYPPILHVEGYTILLF